MLKKLCALVFLGLVLSVAFVPVSVNPFLRFVSDAWATATATTTATATATATALPNYWINSQGSAQWVPVAVGTSTPVTILPQRSRCSWTINWVEAGDLMCAPISSGTTPDFTPSSTQGFRFVHGSTVGQTSAALYGDPRPGWQCVSSSGTLNVYTKEDLYCAKGFGFSP